MTFADQERLAIGAQRALLQAQAKSGFMSGAVDPQSQEPAPRSFDSDPAYGDLGSIDGLDRAMSTGAVFGMAKIRAGEPTYYLQLTVVHFAAHDGVFIYAVWYELRSPQPGELTVRQRVDAQYCVREREDGGFDIETVKLMQFP